MVPNIVSGTVTNRDHRESWARKYVRRTLITVAVFFVAMVALGAVLNATHTGSATRPVCWVEPADGPDHPYAEKLCK